jgi:hypothetical protein
MAAGIVGGGVDSATLTIEGLSWATRSLLVGSWVLQGAAVVAVALVALRLARALDAGDIFREGPAAIMRMGLIVTCSGSAWSILGELGAWRAG